MAEKKILIVEDDRGLNQGITLALHAPEYRFYSAYNLKEARRIWKEERVSLIILDINLPDGSGYTFLEEIRRESEVPVIMLTANDLEIDQVTGFSLGADDYITKPFSLMILRARVERMLARMAQDKGLTYEKDGYRFVFEQMYFTVEGKEVTLSKTEQKLLRILIEHQGQTLTREQLVDRIWSDGAQYVEENALSVTVGRLRKKAGTDRKEKSDPNGIRTWLCVGEIKRQKKQKEKIEGKGGKRVRIFRMTRTLQRLDEMLTKAINGTFTEESYDETELSRLESKWKQYFTMSSMSMERTKAERENIQSMISDISHQMKTPLANIMLYSELLQEQTEGEQEKYLAEQIETYAKKLEFLTMALVKMSRLESDVFKICPSVQRVGSLLRQATEEILPRARQKEIQIEICGDIEGKANFDQKWTQEALYNILDNAVKYSPKGSRIEVEGISYEMYFCIAVKDQGIGIREEERAQIFSRFYRSDLVQQEEGIGIGLYLAREIVQREGGYIKVESKEGNGSIFKIFLQKE